MSTDHIAPGGNLLLLAAPHPASRRLATYLRTILSHCDQAIVSELVMSPQHELKPGDTAIYLRPDATDMVKLALTTDLAAGAHGRSAYAALARLDARWGGVPRLSLDQVLRNPRDTIDRLSLHPAFAVTDKVLAAAERGIASLRADVAVYEHPLAFLASLEESGAEARWSDPGLVGLYGELGALELLEPDVPRKMLIVTASDAAPVEDLTGRAAEWDIDTLFVDSGPGGELTGEAPRYGLIHLHHVVRESGVSTALKRALSWLAPGGLLSGAERSEKGVERVTTRLARDNCDRDAVFVLAGRNWHAVPASWWR